MRMTKLILNLFVFAAAVHADASMSVGDMTKVWCYETNIENGASQKKSYNVTHELLASQDPNPDVVVVKRTVSDPYEVETEKMSLSMITHDIWGQDNEPTDLQLWCVSQSGVMESIQTPSQLYSTCKIMRPFGNITTTSWISNLVPFGLVQSVGKHRSTQVFCTLLESKQGPQKNNTVKLKL